MKLESFGDLEVDETLLLRSETYLFQNISKITGAKERGVQLHEKKHFGSLWKTTREKWEKSYCSIFFSEKT